MLRPYAWGRRLSGIFMLRCARRPAGHVSSYKSPVKERPFSGSMYGVVWRVAQYAWGE